jgi:acetylornithine deacetylase/succinyl-diaminopimelate desuccinylase-like protein
MHNNDDWKELVIPDISELTVLLQSLLKIDTRTGCPDIKYALNLIKNYCINSDLDIMVPDSTGFCDSLVIKIEGSDPDNKGLLLLSHLDTAGWNLKNWMYHPLSAKAEDGKIYGRGAIDCKSLIVIWLQIMKYIKTKDPDRDILLIITTDEETGGETGLKWISENTDILKGFSCALNEGGGYILPSFENKTAITCQYGEKGRIIFPSEHFNDIKELFVREAGIKGFISYIAALLSYYQSNRKFKGCRVRPDLKNSFFNSFSIKNNLAELYYLAGKDSVKKIVTTGGKKSIPVLHADKGQKNIKACTSSLKTELFRIIRNNVDDLNMKIIPLITRGYSDSRHLRCLGIDTYGFFPLGKREEINNIHSHDEFIHQESIYESFRILYKIVHQYTVRR